MWQSAPHCATIYPMNRRNYRRELERLIEKLGGKRPALLLHSCCGPCSSSVLEYLSEYFSITLLWYNPNLYPEQEFHRRWEAQLQIIERMGLEDKVRILALPHRSEDYYSAVQGLEQQGEGGSRCKECFRLRLRECARLAKEMGFDYFCTTLSVSRHKDAVLINALGEEAAAEFQISWLPSDFKKRDGENRSVELSEKHGIYRQLYCGCEFSLRCREAGKPGGQAE